MHEHGVQSSRRVCFSFWSGPGQVTFGAFHNGLAMQAARVGLHRLFHAGKRSVSGQTQKHFRAKAI